MSKNVDKLKVHPLKGPYKYFKNIGKPSKKKKKPKIAFI